MLSWSGVFTSVQLCQRRAVTHWWGADGFSAAFPLQGTPSAHRRTPEDCAGASTIECPLAPAQMLVQENTEGPAGVGLYGVPGASSQGDIGEAEVQGSGTELPGAEAMGEGSTPLSTREDEQEGNRIPQRRCPCRGKCWSPLQQQWVQDSGCVSSTLVQALPPVSPAVHTQRTVPGHWLVRSHGA